MSASPQIFAHRGAKTVAPENTLPAFAAALEMGMAGFELDVQATADGELVVLHDFDLSRTTTGTGLLRNHTLAQLAGVDAGVRFGESFAGTPIPTLAQVFDLVAERGPDDFVVNVEIKNMDWHGGREAGPLVRMIQQRRLHRQVLVSSFNPIALLKMRRLDPSIPLGLLYAPNSPVYLRRAWLAPLIAPEALHPHFQMIDAALVAQAHSRGQALNTWTVNDVNDARRLAGLGVDVLMSDVPDVLMQALEEANGPSG